MSSTMADLAKKVLERLRVIGLGTTPSAARSQAVIDYYAAKFPEMEEDGIGFWPQASIPDQVFSALIDYIAGNVAPTFGLARPDLRDDGETRLRALAKAERTGSVVTGSYF